ncbi:MAG: glutamate--tRNA ligase [Pseudomonadota bacterium]|nr:glutamate--tRNA ligase [Pseudomonadota bacterium]
MTIITRFAPSPTGFLHIGGARTALYNYLYAKKNNGLFKLRIEDTDKQRSKEQYTKDIISNMEWLGLNWDKEIVFQSKNLSYHSELAEQLLQQNKAYRCYCSKDEIEHARNEAIKKKISYKYSGKCRNLNKTFNKPFVIRVKIPINQNTTLHDEILGKIVLKNKELDDFIILRSDKTPTYMLSVVADDRLMKVTNVIRGDDHLTNTFKQLILYNLFEWRAPKFSHIPLIHNKDGLKLSKRHGDLSVNQYKNNNYLPDAINNYLLRLGWGHGDKEFFTKHEAIKLFNLQGVGKSPAKYDENKLEHINTYYFKNLSLQKLTDTAIKYFKIENIDKSFLEKLCLLFQERSENINDFMSGINYMITEKEINLSKNANQIIKNTKKQILDIIIHELKNIKTWNAILIETLLKDIAKRQSLKLFNIASPIRAAITGQTHSPSIFKILELLGKENCIKRLKKSF